MKGIWQFFSERWRMRQAVDFQGRLLAGIELSPDLSRTWTDQIKSILRDASTISCVRSLFTLLPIDADRSSLEIFWAGSVSESMRQSAEAMIRDALRNDPSYPSKRIDKLLGVHNALDNTSVSVPDGAPLTLRTRTFLIDTPALTGAVGVIVEKRQQDAVDAIVIEGILAAAMNIVRSVSAITSYTREIERYATRDPLTGLYNQVAFWDLLEYETERSKRQDYSFSLLLIDIDNFKMVNDTYGHDVGDLFLREFSTVLKASVRKGDIPARYGGDNFTAILPVCDEAQAYTVAQRVIENLKEQTISLPDGTRINETVSIGIAVFPQHAQEARDLFLIADSMVHQAKSSGKDRLSFPSDSDNVEVLRSMSEKNILIMEAVSQRRIYPYFQPIASVKDMRYEAYEVLTRIVMPDRVIPAAEFIETAEGMGMIGKIDYQLYDRAFSIVRDKHYQGKLFLNLSPKALILSDFMPTIRKLMRDYSVEPHQIVFEITERDTVKNLRLVEKFISELKLEGFRFAIDDFGAGYSSFQYIKTFSIDYLKVDGEFIRNMLHKGTMEKAIVTSIAALAGSLGIKTIAEYVESEEILSEVDAAGIDYAQGYYIKRPAPDLR